MVGIFFNLVPSSMLATHRAENNLAASNLAQNILEKLRTTPFDKLPTSPKTEVLKIGAVDFTVTTRVDNITGINPDHVRQARIRVTWKERTKDQELNYELRLFQQNR